MPTSNAAVVRATGALWLAAAALNSHGQTFTLSTEALTQLPTVQEGGPDADTWAPGVGGKTGLPSQKGIWAIYRHEGLWYWFGPYSTTTSADEALRLLNVKSAALRAGNSQRYKAVMVRRLEVDDAALERLKSNKNGIPIDLLLASLRNLEKLTAIGEQLDRMKPTAQQVSLEALAATRLRILRLVSDPSRDAYGSGNVTVDPTLTTGRELENLRAILGAAAARRTLGAPLVETMQRANSMSTSELIQLEAAGLRALSKTNATPRLKEEWQSRIGGALSRIQQGLPQDPGELFSDLGEAVLASLDARRTEGFSLQGSSVALAEMKEAELAARRLQLPELADLVGSQVKRAERRDNSAKSGQGVVGASADMLSAMDSMSFSRSNRQSEQGAVALDAKLASRGEPTGTSFSAAAAVGVRAEAVPELLKDYAAATAGAGSARQAEQTTRQHLREALAESLLEEAGVEPGQRGALTSQQRRALDDAVTRRSGGKYHSQGPASAGAADAVNSAAQLLEASAANGDAALTAGDVRNLAAKNTNGSTSGRGSGSPGGAGTSEPGKSSGGGQATGGSGGLPLPGYMPLFETLARGIAYAFGVDPSTAKSVLMLAYAMNPEAFKKIAADMESLHKQLVDADTANKLNDVNKVLNLLDQIQGEYQKIEGTIAQVMQKGIQPVVKDLVKRGAQAASEQAIKEAAARLGVDPALLRSVMQLPPKWDSGKAASALTEYAKRRALEELEKRGVPSGLGQGLLSGDRNRALNEAKSFVQRRGVEQLREVGLSANASRALMSGDFSKVQSELRTMGESQARQALQKVGYSEQQIKLALSATPERMVEILKSRTRLELEEAVARGESAGKELVQALRGEVDSARAKAQAVDKLVEQARMSRDVALALVEGSLSRVSAEEMQTALWNAGQAMGWRALGDLVGVDPRNLRIYAQSPSWASEINKVVEQVPAALTRNASEEIKRQRALVELAAERERRSYEDLLRQF